MKTAHQFSVYGMSAITAITAQNTVGVQGVFPLSPEAILQQLTSIADDLGFDAIKTGMLGDAAAIHTIASFLTERATCPIVVDPVMVAKGGTPLLDPADVKAVIERLLPLATIVTPNAPEATALTGIDVQSLADCKVAAIRIAQLGPQMIVVKGGHIATDIREHELAVDVVYANGTFTYFAAPRLQTAKTHGTGCTFSSAIASCLARGMEPLAAIAAAKTFIHRAIAQASTWDVGRGHGPTDHSAQ
ncbi:hydroxymethylpyrimidine/phosphomethylpyrimidine kinase [Alicyclobacillus sacchari]|nr:hydroxymethylpyrimidine/phosphomethylpyrimidine kinase [Alicyclobacillus sacchari]